MLVHAFTKKPKLHKIIWNQKFGAPKMDRARSILRAYPPEGITGRGIGIAVLDTGISPLEDFTLPQNRIVAFKDFVNEITTPYDDNGHGTHVTGILSDGLFSGIAHQSNIISLKILDEAGHGASIWALEAIKWIHLNHKKYNIRVVNMSIGTTDSVISSALLNAVKGLYEANITVVAAAGNENHFRISSPGISPYVITAGAIEDKSRFKFKSGRSFYYKPDIFAPSENIISCRSKNFSFAAANRGSERIYNENYISMSGTSMATPMISGAAALLYQFNPSFTPYQVKKILNSVSATNGHVLNIEKVFKSLK